MEFKITNIDLLGDAREKYITKLNLKLEADRMNDSVARELGQLLKASPGKCKVTVQLDQPAGNHGLGGCQQGLQVSVRGVDRSRTALRLGHWIPLPTLILYA
jgi:hypothetical protein